MTTEMWLIAAVRLLVRCRCCAGPWRAGSSLWRWTSSDLFMMNLIDLGGVDDYQTFDKYLDQAYLLTFLVVALRWEARRGRSPSASTSTASPASPSSR